MSMSCWFIL